MSLRRPHMEAALNGDRQVFDISRRNGGGRRRSWQVVYQPRIEDGEVVGFFGVYQDNTARREAEEGLKRAYETLETRVEERTAALKAESEARWRWPRTWSMPARRRKRRPSRKRASSPQPATICSSPLSAARLFAGALEEDLKDGSDGQAKLAQRIERSIDHADRLLRALLDISRLDAGGVTPRESVFSLGRIDAGDRRAIHPGGGGEGIEAAGRACRLAVFSDRGLMTSVLQNLISNAVRYTNTGTVLVGARRQGDTVRLQVIDTGPGVPEERQRDIFKEFERGANADQTDRGLGLGLAVVDRICTTLGHKLRLQSKEGHGSTFEVTLPRAASKPSAKTDRAPPAEALDGLKVLCLDDEAPVLEATVALLQRWGCDARGARDDASAKAAFNGTTPDVVLLDFQLENGQTGPGRL
jgi:anti-sigma regulatory factor (Ser/Thr protein kinase)